MTDDRAVLVARLRHVLAARPAAAVAARQNIIVCGGVGAGKTSLRTLSNEVPTVRP